jgi:tetratricopeptide (TPR) repeat protein
VTDLWAIRLSRAELAGEHLNLAAAAARYEKTFDAAGLNVQALGAATVAERIKASPIRNELIAALDVWATCIGTVPQLEKIYDVAQRADPDPLWRDKVRDASIINNAQALTDLAVAAPIAQQSASILVALGHRIELGKGNPVPFCRRVQLHYPNDFWANFQLASVLQMRRDPESITYYLAARAIRPDVLVVNLNLSAELSYHGRGAEALEYSQRAIVIDPRSVLAHADLGVCLGLLGRYDEAVAACRNALTIDPKSYFAVGVMCQALINDGRLVEANAAIQKYLKEMPKGHPDYAGLNRLAAHCEELVKREHQLSDVLAGKEQITPNRRRQLAIVCLLTRRYDDAVRLFDDAFAAQPALADDVLSDARLEAACAAARAAEQTRDVPERVRLLNKAIAWLHADLAVWSGVLDRGKESERQLLLKSVYPWRWEPRLASIREREAILGWLPEQQAQCRALWRDVNALIMRAEAAAPSADLDEQITSDLLVQARERVAQRDWAAAVNSYARILAYGPTDDGHFWFEYAAVRLLSGDRPGYRAACIQLIERCGKPGGPRAYHVARTGTLAAADGAPDASLLGRLARNELQQNATQFWSLTEQGALAYRAGRFEEAVSLFEQSLKADAHPGRAVVNWAWLALAEQRLGKTEEARRWLVKTQNWLDQYREGIPPNADAELGLHLHNWLEANVLRQEAEALLGSK